MSENIFGTDGLRGEFGSEFINPEYFTKLGYVVGIYLCDKDVGGIEKPKVVIGRDTRASGEELSKALITGLNASGVYDVKNIGIIPTPALAMEVFNNGADFGAVITASHNSASDNGIKFLSKEGRKLDVEAEREITKSLSECSVVSFDKSEPPQPVTIRDGYLESVGSLFSKGDFKGWKIVIDMANGAACQSAPIAFGRLGADIITLGDEPNGGNINDGCGSEHPQILARRVLDEGARLGIAFDGDGDRLVLCDEEGSVLDGDEALTLLALHALKQGKLCGEVVVVTIMSNLGLNKALNRAGIRVERVAVGDRNVVHKMMEEKCSLGGESSGHIIFPDHFPTADGLYAALKVLEVMKETGRPLSQLRRCVQLQVQIKKNIKVARKIPFDGVPEFTDIVEELEKEMVGTGRLLMRYSGTESLLRLLVEGENREQILNWMARLEKSVAEHLPCG